MSYISIPLYDSGVYTPTLFNTTNIDASTAFECQWVRINDVVIVSGKVDVDPTAGAATELGMSLPIASNLATEQQLAGTGSHVDGAAEAVQIKADVTNNRAQFNMTHSGTTNHSHFFTFMYKIIL